MTRSARSRRVFERGRNNNISVTNELRQRRMCVRTRAQFPMYNISTVIDGFSEGGKTRRKIPKQKSENERSPTAEEKWQLDRVRTTLRVVVVAQSFWTLLRARRTLTETKAAAVAATFSPARSPFLFSSSHFSTIGALSVRASGHGWRSWRFSIHYFLQKSLDKQQAYLSYRRRSVHFSAHIRVISIFFKLLLYIIAGHRKIIFL